MDKLIRTEIELRPDGKLDRVVIRLESTDGSDLSSQEIFDAVADILLLYWNSDKVTYSKDYNA